MDKNELYYHFIREKNPGFHVSERTAQDLNLNEVFAELNCTVSFPGRQMWFSRVRAQAYAGYDDEKKDDIARFSNDEIYSEKAAKALRKIASDDAGSLVSLFAQALPAKSLIFLKVIRGLQLALLVSVALLFFAPALGCVLSLMLVMTNLILHYRNKMELSMYDYSISQIVNLLKCSKALREAGASPTQSYVQVVEAEKELKFVSVALRWFKPSNVTISDFAVVAWALGELFKVLTLIEVYSYAKTIQRLQGRQSFLQLIYEFVGEKDILRSIALLRKCTDGCVVPGFHSGKRNLCFEEISHPLIQNCVSNSLCLSNSSVLLTGSNMSGKSTFIRTVGVNVLLAQNILTCFARSFCLSMPLKVTSMMQVQDDLNENKSLFFAEVLAVKGMLEIADAGDNLFLLDEMFKGTNTVERIAGAAAVLDFLVKDNLVFAATHDVELTRMVDASYHTYHFCEQVKHNQIVFDYTLYEGVLKEFNALKILKLNQFPDEVIRNAYRRVDAMSADTRAGLASSKSS